MARTESNKHSSKQQGSAMATAANSQQIPGGPVSREDRGLLLVSNELGQSRGGKTLGELVRERRKI